jgi:tetratricopeptide (TPR) repeat protein
MIKSSWYTLPAAFFLCINFLVSPVKIFFFKGLIYFLFFLFLFFFLRNINLSRVIKLSVGGAAGIIFVYGIIQKFFLFPRYLETLKPEDSFYSRALIRRIESGRIFSIFALPTLYAIICVIFILFILHYLISSKKKIFWALLLLLGLFNLILTQSFGGLLYLSIGVLLYLFLSGILNLRFLAPLIMLLSLFFFIVVGLRFSEVKTLEPIKLRLSNWNQAIRIIKSNPFWGVGLGNYEAEVSYHIRPGESASIFSHNFFLQFGSETGLLFPIWLFIFAVFQRKKLKPPDQRDKLIYIPVFIILIFYNLIDIGFYFFSSALITTVVLSQIYVFSGDPVKKRVFNSYISLILMVAMGSWLIWDGVSDNFQKAGEFYLNQKDFAESGKSYRKSLAINPFDYKSHIGLGVIAFSQGKIRQAQGHLQEAILIYPDSAFSHFLLSKISFREGRVVNAFLYAENARKKDRLNSQYREWSDNIKEILQRQRVRVGTK